MVDEDDQADLRAEIQRAIDEAADADPLATGKELLAQVTSIRESQLEAGPDLTTDDAWFVEELVSWELTEFEAANGAAVNAVLLQAHECARQIARLWGEKSGRVTQSETTALLARELGEEEALELRTAQAAAIESLEAVMRDVLPLANGPSLQAKRFVMLFGA
jgi:hypothetical protein